jgi:ribonuclease P protein component
LPIAAPILTAPAKSAAPAGHTLRPRERVRSNADFKRIYAAKQSVRGGGLTVAYLLNGKSYSRLGLSVSSRHGNAVRRNRIKRTFRAAFRELKAQLPAGYDFVLIPTQPPKEPTTALAKESLLKALARLPKRMP